MSEFRLGRGTRWALSAASTALVVGCSVAPSGGESAPTQPNHATASAPASPSTAPEQGPPPSCTNPDGIISYEIDATDVKKELLGKNGPDASRQMWGAFQRASEKLLQGSHVPEHSRVAISIVIGPVATEQEVADARRLQQDATAEFADSQTYSFISDKPVNPVPDALANQTLLSLTPLVDSDPACRL